MIRYVVVLGLGYVLGAKAGRRRYEQIASTYRAMTGSPAAKSIIDAGRRKIADRVSPDPTMVTLTEIDGATTVLQPQSREAHRNAQPQPPESQHRAPAARNGRS